MSKLEEEKGFLLSLIRSRYLKEKEERQSLNEENKAKCNTLEGSEEDVEKVKFFPIGLAQRNPIGLVQRKSANSLNAKGVSLECEGGQVRAEVKGEQTVRGEQTVKGEQTYACPLEKSKKKRGRKKVKNSELDQRLGQENELVQDWRLLSGVGGSDRVGGSESEKEKRSKRRGRRKKIEVLSLEGDDISDVKASHKELKELVQEEIKQENITELCFEDSQGDVVDIFDVKDSIYQDSYGDNEEVFNDSEVSDDTNSQRSEYEFLSLQELEERARLLGREVANVVYAVIENKGLNLGQRTFLMKKIAQNFIESFRDKKGVYIYITALFDQFYGKQVSKISNYMYRLYLSKDYEYFRKLRPIDVVRYVRFYFGKSKHYIPFRFVPYLLKEARRIKMSIYNRIQYYIKKEGYFIDKAQAFEMIKEKSETKLKK
ncbi:MAG: hypothetical protein QXG36_07685 [Nitrososphaeria archaeon]